MKSKEYGSCTIGAKILSPDEVVLFKNKDFHMKRFDDRVSIDRWYFGVMGKWSAFTTNVFSGLSIGVNSSGICCCNSHVRSIKNARNGDILIEKVIRECSNVDNGIKLVQSEITRRSYDWYNIILASPEEVAVLEVGDQVKTMRNMSYAARTNHPIEQHESIASCSMDQLRIKSSENRYQCAMEFLQKATCVEDVFNLCKSHIPQKSYSVCCHGDASTVYSYIIHISHGQVIFYVCKGNPCKGIYVPISITFPLEDQKVYEMLKKYPSKNP